jgi:putative ABC transport system permease protein
MLWNSLLLALRSIRRNLMRSFLTVLGIVIGVSAVITMVTLGQGATRAVQDQIASLGSNLLQVRPGQRLGPGGDGGAPTFVEGDAQAIATQIGGVRAVAPEVRRGVTLVQGARNWSSSVVGTTAAYFETNNWVLADGRGFDEAEERAGAAVCVVGATVRRELFGSTNPLGASLRVRQFSCTVIGLLAAKGAGVHGAGPGRRGAAAAAHGAAARHRQHAHQHPAGVHARRQRPGPRQGRRGAAAARAPQAGR